MGVLQDTSRVFELFVLLGGVSLAVAYRQGADPDWVAIGVLVLGLLAVLLVAYRFSEDFEGEG